MTDQSPLFSLLIPVYNTADYLEDCLESVLAQTPEDIEILLYNDGSTDGSDQICRAYQERYPDVIQYFPAALNRGISAARNILISKAKGDYVWFLDSDDYMLPDSLQRAKQVCQTQSVDMLICDYLIGTKTYIKSFAGPRNTVSEDREALVAGIFKCQKMYFWQKIIKRKIFENVPPFPEGRIFEDVFLIPHILLNIKSYFYLPEPCISYRRRAGSIVMTSLRTRGVFKAKMHQDMVTALEQISVLLQDDHRFDDETLFWVSNFVAKRYCKTASLYKASKAADLPNLSYYRQAFEACSPFSFSSLFFPFLLKGRWVMLTKLHVAMWGSSAA